MSPPNDKARLAVPRNDAHERILDRIEKAAEIKADDIQSERDLADAQERERRWHKYNLELLSRLFNTDKYVEEYRASRRPVHVVSDRYFDPSVSDLAGRLVGSVKSQISALHSIIERLELSDEGTIPVSSVESAVETAVQAERNLELLAERFHLAACQIQSRHAKRPTLIVKDEYDVQDLLHALLTIFFDDI